LRTTAFRLPKELLDTLNDICAEPDCTRSQLIRRSLNEYIRFHELDRVKQREQKNAATRVEAAVKMKPLSTFRADINSERQRRGDALILRHRADAS
jgi:metal-responsive CopG/Arc/MetJ family transcriptional regulator